MIHVRPTLRSTLGRTEPTYERTVWSKYESMRFGPEHPWPTPSVVSKDGELVGETLIAIETIVRDKLEEARSLAQQGSEKNPP